METTLYSTIEKQAKKDNNEGIYSHEFFEHDKGGKNHMIFINSMNMKNEDKQKQSIHKNM